MQYFLSVLADISAQQALIAILVLTVSAGIVASICQLFWNDGPRKVLLMGSAYALTLAFAVFTVRMIFFRGSYGFDIPGSILTYALTAAILCVMMITTLAFIFGYSRTAHFQREMSDKAKWIGIAMFAEIDEKGAGKISRQNVMDALAKLPPNETEKRLVLKHILRNFDYIGKVVSSHEKVVPFYVPNMFGVGSVVPTKMVLNIYAITREDLRRYPDRIGNRYEIWLAA